MGTMILSTLFTLFMAFGLAYIIWVLSAKESGNIRTIGMSISIIIIVLALIMAVMSGRHSRWSSHKYGAEKGMTTTQKSEMTKDTGTHKPMHSLKKHVVK
jgi:hypothetical protein